MVETVVRYLRSQGVSFRLLSYPVIEQAPPLAYAPDGRNVGLLAASILRVDGIPAIAAIRAGGRLNLLGAQAELRVSLVEPGSTADLPWPYTQASEPVPALGKPFGLALLLDTAVMSSAKIAFPIFSRYDFIELACDDYARIEQPRLVSLTSQGALPEARPD